MEASLTSGSTLVLLAGVCQGSFLAPAKAIRKWAWENYWFIFAATAYFLSPWILALITVPHLFSVYRDISFSVLLLVTVFGIGWGLGALFFGLAIEAVGLSLGFAIILGTSAAIGTLVPLIATHETRTPHTVIVTVAWLTLMLLGVTVCSLSGKWRESDSARPRSYSRGLAICLLSGLLSGSGNLGFFFGREIAEKAHLLGAPDYSATNAIWTFLALPLFICNGGYAVYLMRRNDTAQLYRTERSVRDGALALSMGVLWMAGFSLYGAGARRLGALGPSLGWAMMMATMVVVANALGIATGEWTGAPLHSKRQLAIGLLLLICAVVGLGLSNH
ncbi:MAG: hypothetical protein JO108_20650 [Acidobacteriaceae bacterium]|nr:hypothetical protein [Acidobacteriaceae bacterium]